MRPLPLSVLPEAAGSKMPRIDTYLRRTRLPLPASALERWHRRPGALERLLPPWLPVRVPWRDPSVDPGSRAVLEVGVGPIRRRWTARHEALDGRGFRDVQEEGPFARWVHDHRFLEDGEGAAGERTSVLEDRVEYALPLQPVSRWLLGGAVRRRLDRAFAYRHRVAAADVGAHQRRAGAGPLRVAVTGSTGLVGTQLVAYLRAGGHRVVRLVRREPRPDREEVRWDPGTGYVDTAGLSGVDAVVHLAGESIVGRWTEEKKEAVRRSRARGTRGLAESLAEMDPRPDVLVSASGVNYYGDRGEERLTEESGPGEGFLPEVCLDWEGGTRPAAEAGIRVVPLRIGMVLTPSGGALERMLPAFRLGLGGPLGSGRQWMSWIALDDLLEVIHHVLADDGVRGPVNACAPTPVRNRELAGTLAAVLSRRALARVPAGALRLAFGEMADEMLLASVRAVPGALTRAGYRFRYPTLEEALRHVLGRTTDVPAAVTRGVTEEGGGAGG